MPAGQGPQDFKSISTLVIVVVTLGVVYWRTTLRIAAILVITLAIYGTYLVIEGLHHLTR